MAAGFFPFAMLYKDESGKVADEWVSYHTSWANRYKVGAKMSKFIKNGGLKDA
jgi:hypothetical protein